MTSNEVEVKADIFWNLPALVNYRPGTELPYSISAANLNEEERLFMLRARTFDSLNRVITEDVILVNGAPWFAVEGGDREEIDGVLRLEETDVLLGVFLVDKESSKEADTVYTFLKAY